MPQYDNSYLLAQIKRKAFMPNVQETFTDDDLLAIATDELQGIIVPIILSTREEFYVNLQEDEITTKNQEVEIPNRAIGKQLREVSVVVGGVERNLARYDIEDRVYEDVGGNLYGFEIYNNKVRVKGSPAGTLRQYFYLAPGVLVQPSAAALIQSIDTGTNSIVVNSIPTGWAVGEKFDFIKPTPGFDTVGLSQEIANIVGTTVTFTSSLPTEIAVGTWVARECESPVAQMPAEFFQYLAEACVAYIMESLGDEEGFKRAERRKEELKQHAVGLISPRVDGSSKKFVARRNRGASIYQQWRGN